MSKYPIKFNLIGERFGKLFVFERKDINNHVAWLCKCDCGKTINVPTGNLRRKRATKSCGCLKIEKTKEKNTKHGKKGSRVYNTWVAMKKRCLNPNDKNFSEYGGRGIKICEEWNEFVNFYRDMGDPEKGMTLDRIDNSLGYFKGNCRWANIKIQNNNRRSDKRVIFRGEECNLFDLYNKYMKPLGLNSSTLYRRLKKGLTLEEALFTREKIMPKNYNIKVKKKKDSLGRFCK